MKRFFLGAVLLTMWCAGCATEIRDGVDNRGRAIKTASRFIFVRGEELIPTWGDEGELIIGPDQFAFKGRHGYWVCKNIKDVSIKTAYANTLVGRIPAGECLVVLFDQKTSEQKVTLLSQISSRSDLDKIFTLIKPLSSNN